MKSLQEAAENSTQASKNTVKVTDQVETLIIKGQGAVDELTSSLRSLHQVVQDLDLGIKTILDSANVATKAAAESLQQLTALESKLTESIDADNRTVVAILQQMLKVVQDPNIQAIMGNVNNATGSAAEILKSVDQSTRWLRQKVSVVKALISRILGLIKITFSPIP